MFEASGHLDIDPEDYGLEPGGRVQQIIDNAVISYDLQYVPWETGMLGESAFSATEIGSGEVVYPGPYAHYQYYGIVYGPSIPIFEDNTGEPTGFFSPRGVQKIPTDRELQYSTDINPLAGSYWFERMKADHLQDIIEEVRNGVGK